MGNPGETLLCLGEGKAAAPPLLRESHACGPGAGPARPWLTAAPACRLEALLQRADVALYRAKGDGRHLLVVAP